MRPLRALDAPGGARQNPGNPRETGGNRWEIVESAPWLTKIAAASNHIGRGAFKMSQKRLSETLLTKRKTMAEPGINEIEGETPAQCDSLPIVSHSPKRRGGGDEIAFLSIQQAKNRLAVIDDPCRRAALSIAYHRGLRASEVGMLQMSGTPLLPSTSGWQNVTECHTTSAPPETSRICCKRVRLCFYA